MIERIERIVEAFQTAPRRKFLPDDSVENAGFDQPLPIGFGQANSQPSTVARMLEWLAVEPGQKILDVGSGSGWTSALLAHLTGQQGTVDSVEAIPELLEFGRANCQKLNIKNVRFHQAGQTYGWPQNAPYDRILVGAAAQALPPQLKDQLASLGRMVIPVRDSILIVDKDEQGEIDVGRYHGYDFVPLVPAGNG